MLRLSWRLIGGLVLLLGFAPAALAAGHAKYFILVVWDGMRSDFVTPELTPALYGLRHEGVWFANHHSVYPTSTEVNGARHGRISGAQPHHGEHRVSPGN